MGYKAKNSPFSKVVKKAMRPIDDNVKFPMEGKNKIWDAKIDSKYKVHLAGKYSQKVKKKKY